MQRELEERKAEAERQKEELTRMERQNAEARQRSYRADRHPGEGQVDADHGRAITGLRGGRPDRG